MQPAKVELDQGHPRFLRPHAHRAQRVGRAVPRGRGVFTGELAGIERHTKDMDIFAREGDRDRILRALEAAGYRTEITFPHWLAKAWIVERFVNVIYRSGNGVAEIDDDWFAHARESELLGIPVRLCPPEEIIWSKAYIMERERFDGADIAHLIRKSGREFDWHRLLRRFGADWRVLFSHLILFGFIYPGERDIVPAWILRELSDRLSRRRRAGAGREGLPGHAPVARAISGRHRHVGL